MTIDQLRHFVATIESNGMTRAAEQLYISHSSISKSIGALEKELGCKLLNRTGKIPVCTPAGSLLYEKGSRLLRELDSLSAEVAKLGAENRQELRILCVDFYIPFFHQLLLDFSELHEDVIYKFDFCAPQDFIRTMAQGSFPLGISFVVSKAKSQSTMLDCLPLERGRFCVVAGRTHPLAQQKIVTPEELVGCPDVIPTRDLSLVPVGGVLPYPFTDIPLHHQNVNLSDLRLQIKMGLCVVSLPEHVASDFRSDCAIIPLKDGASYEIGLYYPHRRHNPLIDQFVENAQINLRNGAPGDFHIPS